VAYERLVRGYQEVAFRTAYLITGDPSEAEEATQEAFVKAYRALGRFRSGGRFRPWLLAIVANEARNQRRATTRREQAWDASLAVLQVMATAIISAFVFGWWLAPVLVGGLLWWRRRNRDSRPAATES
jgi:RNA polymerase sigma factor (sigma-70 family)